MKKILNSTSTVINDMLAGLTAATPELRQLENTQVIVRRDAPVPGKVGLISGGGSGHEPAHAGYVGPGMLDAACAGDVFSSPSVDQMLAAIRAVDSGSGVLIIAKNYTGDNLNFDLAAELASDMGIRVEKVVVRDDVAVEESANTTGRRGVAGTVLVHKIAGAKAATGADLDAVLATARKAADRVRSFGFALAPCIIPSVGKPSFTLAEDEMELGTGIHGEVGVQRMPLQSSAWLAEEVTGRILRDMPLASGSEVAVLVNGAGATPLMELYVLYNDVHARLQSQGLRVVKAYVGEYMSSLEMAGASVTLLALDDELKTLLLMPADTPGFKQSGAVGACASRHQSNFNVKML